MGEGQLSTQQKLRQVTGALEEDGIANWIEGIQPKARVEAYGLRL